MNHVPNYDVHGHHHHREPYKDKSYLLQEDIRHPKWLQPSPHVRTRSELQQARRKGRVPDPSYDFDGDGVVGHQDFFIGRSFDKDRDGRLTTGERTKAQEALRNGFMAPYSEVKSDTARIMQRNGVLINDDNIGQVGKLLYPPHHNASNVPDVSTQTALALSRRAELKGAGTAFGEKYAADNAPIIEPQPPNAQTEPRQCPISHIRERAEADHQASRTRAGLLPVNAPVNPERELKEVGLERVEDPYFGTRGQLFETRRAVNKRDCEDLRKKGETCVPHDVRKTEKEVKQYEFRRTQGEPMTQTRLFDQRRQERREYDMLNFKVPTLREFPHFSDRPDVPFWEQGKAMGAAGHDPPRAMARTVSEPVLKITEVPFGTQEPHQEKQPMHSTAGRPVDGPKNQFGSHTVRRWTTDMLERGQGRNKPRLFDNIQPVRIGPLDLMPLEITSSIECIRNAACKGREEERQRVAASPLRSILFNDSSQVQPSANGTSNSRMGSKIGQGSQRDPGTDGSKVTIGGSAQSRRGVTADPAMRATFNTTLAEKPRDPRFFGSMTRPMSQTGVRCGGFQRFEPPPKQARSQKTRVRQEHHPSKERTRSDMREAASPATPGAAPAAQQL